MPSSAVGRESSNDPSSLVLSRSVDHDERFVAEIKE
jgi:hypothetical protein